MIGALGSGCGWMESKRTSALGEAEGRDGVWSRQGEARAAQCSPRRASSFLLQDLSSGFAQGLLAHTSPGSATASKRKPEEECVTPWKASLVWAGPVPATGFLVGRGEFGHRDPLTLEAEWSQRPGARNAGGSPGASLRGCASSPETSLRL